MLVIKKTNIIIIDIANSFSLVNFLILNFFKLKIKIEKIIKGRIVTLNSSSSGPIL